jgi:hypothetical protein
MKGLLAAWHIYNEMKGLLAAWHIYNEMKGLLSSRPSGLNPDFDEILYCLSLLFFSFDFCNLTVILFESRSSLDSISRVL